MGATSHSDYIASWLDVLREDNRAIVRAASQASKASDFLLGFLNDTSGQGARVEGADGADVEAEADAAVAA